MTSFIGLYRGETLADAKIVAVSADPQIVAEFAARLLPLEAAASQQSDPVLAAIHGGRRRALRIVKKDAADSIKAQEEK